MADIVGVIFACVELSARLYDYIEGVSGAPKNIGDLLGEICTLRGILESILERRPRGAADHGLSGALHRGLAIIDDLRGRLAPKTSWIGRQVQSMTWPLKEELVAKNVGNLRGISQALMLLMISDLQSVPQAIDEVKELGRDTLKGVENVHSLMRQEAARRSIKDERKARRAFMSDLAPTSPDSIHQYTCRFWEGFDFGAWLLQGPLRLWRDMPKSPVMILCGGSGSGKSTLVSRVIEHQKLLCPAGTLAYFYCTYSDAKTQDTRAVLGSWLVQLAVSKPSVLDRLQAQISPKKRAISLADLEDAIIDIAATTGTATLILDALNESKDAMELASSITRLASSSTAVRVLISSTSEGLLTRQGCPCRRIDMNPGLVGPDIEAYIKKEIQKYEVLGVAGEREILATLVPQADGSFLWASYQIAYLSSLPSADDVLQSLDSLPNTLDKIYADRLQRVLNESPHWQRLVQEALTWLAYSLKPLTLDELAEAVVIRDGVKAVGRKSRLLRREDLLDKCQNLVRWNPRTNIVTLAHGSIKAFLEGVPLQSSSMVDFAIGPKDGPRSIVQTSLTYLLMEVFRLGNSDKMESYHDAYPLLDHASTMWPLYVQEFDFIDSAQDATLELILTLFQTHRSEERGGQFAFWIRCLLRVDDYLTIERAHPLYYAASFGLTAVVKAMLERGLVDLKNRDSIWYLDRPSGRHSSTALQVAVFRNHLDTARILMKYGADPNSTDIAGTSCISWARALNNQEMVLILKKKDPASQRTDLGPGALRPENSDRDS